MNKKKLSRRTLLVVLVLGSAVLSAKLLMSSRSQADSRHASGLSTALDIKARLAKSGDETATDALADELVNRFAVPEARDTLLQFKDRLVHAEMNYRRGGQAGISEQKLANSLNKLNRELGLPESGRVSPSQLRYLRVNLMTAFPNYVSESSDQRPGKAILANDLSPLEATGLSLVVINNKLSNDKFQLAPGEWAAAKHREDVAKWEAHRRGRPEPERKSLRTRIAVERSQTNQFRQAFEAHIDDAPQIIDRFLAQMGIPRKEKNR